MMYGLGYNGGGAYLSYCMARPADGSEGTHNDGSGGGMTHISRTKNVAMASPSIYGKGSWNPDGTIAIAGGGGGDYNGFGGGLTSPAVFSERGNALGATQSSGWSRGCGRSAYGTGGGGGGWYGGNIAEGIWLNVSYCEKGVTGGTGYINTDKVNNGYTNMTLVFNRPGYETKPCNRHYGYARVSLLKRN